MLIDAAGRVNTAGAIRALSLIALESPDAESRVAALEKLRETGRSGLSAPFVSALRSKHNQRVNLAADALAELEDQLTLAPLIDALVTTHRQRIGADTQGDTYSFNAAAGQSLSAAGGPGPCRPRSATPSVHARWFP